MIKSDELTNIIIPNVDSNINWENSYSYIFSFIVDDIPNNIIRLLDNTNTSLINSVYDELLNKSILIDTDPDTGEFMIFISSRINKPVNNSAITLK